MQICRTILHGWNFTNRSFMRRGSLIFVIAPFCFFRKFNHSRYYININYINKSIIREYGFFFINYFKLLIALIFWLCFKNVYLSYILRIFSKNIEKFEDWNILFFLFDFYSIFFVCVCIDWICNLYANCTEIGIYVIQQIFWVGYTYVDLL